MSQADTPGIYSEVSKSIRTKAEETQQLQDRAYATRVGDARQPPVDPVTLARLLEENTTHAKCVYSKARNVAGYGFEIVPHPDVDDPDESQREALQDFWFGEDSVWQVGPDQQERATPSDVLEMSWIDYEGIGWLSIEVLTSMDGTPMGLAYVPAMTIRKRRTHDEDGVKQHHGFAQVIDGETRYYGIAGDRYGEDRIFVDSQTGNYGSSVANPANELIFKRNPSPLHAHYGTPDIIPARRSLRGKKAAEEYNIAFFENDTVPRQYVIIEGGELTDKAWDTLQKRLGDQKGASESHRTLLLEVQRLASESGMMNLDEGYEPQDVSIEIEPMTVGQNDDASFLAYQDATEHDVLQAHSVPPMIAGVLKSGAFSTDTEEQRKEFSEHIDHKQANFAGLLHETVHKALGVTDWQIDFQSRGLENRETQLEMAKTQIEASQGALTLNEVRELLGKDPIDRPVGEQLLLEAGGQPGGITASIQNMIEEREAEIREEQARQDRVDAMIERAPED